MMVFAVFAHHSYNKVKKRDTIHYLVQDDGATHHFVLQINVIVILLTWQNDRK